MLFRSNACAFWLLMGMRERKVQPEAGAATLFAQADVLRRRAEDKAQAEKASGESLWVRGPDRRRKRDASYKGPERRQGGDRRDRKHGG